MKKILIFNGYYYPSKKCGGPVTSIENIINACCYEFEFYIICYNHDFNDKISFNVEINKWLQVGNAKVMYVEPGYLDFSFKRTRILCEKLKPDLIWFSGVLTPNNKIVTVKIAKKLAIPVLFSPRGEVSKERVKLKAYKKIPYLNLLRISGIYKNCYFHGTSEDEEAGIRKYFKPDKDHIFKVSNIAIMQQPDMVRFEKKKGYLRLFFFSRIHEVKNLLFAIQAVNQCRSNIIFDIYGPIEDYNYWEQCENEIKNSPQNIIIRYVGILQHLEMNSTIQSYDAFLFPTINENFGHVIAESLANSRPVILSKGTTPWDDLHEKAGFVETLDDISAFIRRIEYYAELNEHQYGQVIENTKKYFMEKMGKNEAINGHLKMLHSITNK